MKIFKVLSSYIVAAMVFTSQPMAANNNDILSQATRLINQQKQVEAFLLLRANESCFATPQEKYVYDYLSAKVLKKAFEETADEYYSKRYIQHLEASCQYMIDHYSDIAPKSAVPIWKMLTHLSEYYKQTKNDRFQQLMENISRHHLPLIDQAFPVFQNYYSYNLDKGLFWGNTEIFKLGAELTSHPKGNNELAVKALHLSVIGQLHHNQDFVKGDYYEDELAYKLNLIDSLYQTDKALAASPDALHRWGDWANYYFILGQKTKAEQLLNKEKQLIVNTYGEESAEFAWYLYHKAFIEKLEHQKSAAKEHLRTAKRLFSQAGADELSDCKYQLVNRDFNGFLEFNEQDTTNYPITLTTYQAKIDRIPLMYTSTNRKMVELSEIKLNLMKDENLSADAIVKAIDAIVQLKLAEPAETNEFVALPNDLLHLYTQSGNKELPHLITSIIENGDANTAQIDVMITLITLLQKKALSLPTLKRLVDLYTKLTISSENWEGALPALQLGLALNDGKTQDDVLRAKQLAQMSRCRQELHQPDSCRFYLKQCEKLMHKIALKDETSLLSWTETYYQLCEVYALWGDTKKSLYYADRVLEIGKQNFKTLPFFYAASYQKALQHYENGDYAAATQLMSPVCSADERIHKFDNYQSLLIESLCQQKDSMAFIRLQQYMDYSVNTIIPEYFSALSQFKRDSLWSVKANRMIQLNTQFAQAFPEDRYKEYAYNNVVFAKSLDINFNHALRQTISQSDDFHKSIFMQMQIAQDSLHFGSPQHRIFYKNRIAYAQSTLPSLFSEEKKQELLYRGYYTYLKQMQENMAIVEFVSLRNGKDVDYYAYVTQKDNPAPQLIKVISKKQLSDKISTEKEKINALYQDTFLYKNLWNKIKKVLNPEVNSIFLIPSGQLNRINFNAIMMPSGKPISDVVTFNRITSTASLVRRDRRFHFKKDIDVALFGGIFYRLSDQQMESESQRYGNNSTPINRTLSTDRKQLGFLGHTQTEINRIAQTLSSTPLKVKKFSGAEGSESAFKSFNRKSPLIIHIATHGFYLEKDRKKHTFYNANDQFHYTDKSLLYSGLLMAGAQSAWEGKPVPTDVDDGILTADEISRMDLSQTELVVLSACETALGDIDDTEGVLGLQRAFKKADANFVVMSLWPVNDAPTALLMSNFYENIMNKKKLNEALLIAMRKVKESYPDPADWAGFILIK